MTSSEGGWLLKSEPDAFSWDQQVSNGVEPWTGVRSHSAKRHLAAMKRGDLAFFYHSNIGKEIVGVVEIVREAYPDPTASKGEWLAVDTKAVRPVERRVTLAQMRTDDALAEFLLLKQSRLSVVPVRPQEWVHVCKLAGLSASDLRE